MDKVHVGLPAMCFFALLLGGCVSTQTVSTTPTGAGLANPASVYCQDHGGKLEIRTGPGGEFGVCLFPDSTECDEWAFFRGECQPGQTTLVPSPDNSKSSGGSVDETGWLPYANTTYRYAFQYPPNVEIREENNGESLEMTGSVAENEHRPVIYINHRSRDDFRPPMGADLMQWLTENNLLQGELREDRIIGGETAAHLFVQGGDGSYDQDTFYFSHIGRLYQIVLLHAGKQDWNVYNRFLDSFVFTG